MLFYPQMPPERRRFLHALVVPSMIALVVLLSFVIQQGMGWSINRWGVQPRTLQGVPGIFLHPLAHANFSHLLNNEISLFILLVALFYFYREIANTILLLLWPSTGLLLWLIGRDSIHIGASGIIYGLTFFVFWGGLLMRNISLLAISLAIVFWYGSMVWDMFPFLPNEQISWEGHLSGAICGSLLAFLFRKAHIQGAVPEVDEGSVENEELTQMAMKYEQEGDLIEDEQIITKPDNSCNR